MTYQTLERIFMNTFPPVVTAYRNGWILGLSGGYSRRANCVFTYDYVGEDISQDVAHCEAVYALYGAKARFRTSDKNLSNQSLTTYLTKAGYQASVASPVKAIDFATQAPISHPEFTWTSTFSDAWLKTYFTLNSVKQSLYQSHKLILNSITGSAIYGQIGDHALGLAVISEEFAAFYNIVVNPNSRGQGYGRAIMQSLMATAQQQGAIKGILSVDGENTVANRLYDSLGFVDEYAYHYWSKP